MEDYYQDGFNEGYGQSWRNEGYGQSWRNGGHEYPQSDGDRYSYNRGVEDGQRRREIARELDEY